MSHNHQIRCQEKGDCDNWYQSLVGSKSGSIDMATTKQLNKFHVDQLVDIEEQMEYLQGIPNSC